MSSPFLRKWVLIYAHDMIDAYHFREVTKMFSGFSCEEIYEPISELFWRVYDEWFCFSR